MKFRIGDVVTPILTPDTAHKIIRIERDMYIMERLGTDRVDQYEIKSVDSGGRKLTKLELALK